MKLCGKKFWLAFLLLASCSVLVFGQGESVQPETSPPTRSLKVPPGLSIDPTLSDLGDGLLMLRTRLIEQNKASRTFADSLTDTAPKLEESSQAVSGSLTTASTEASATSSSLTDASTTLSDTSKASTAYDASVDKTEADLARGRWIWGACGAALGAGVVLVVEVVRGWIRR